MVRILKTKRLWECWWRLVPQGWADVSLFLAADGVHLLNCSETGKVVGEGTGDLKEHLDFLQSANTTLWVSGMSAKARGYDENLLEGFNAQFAMPNRLVEASLEADTVLCY